jgi:hypothetical protein
MNIQHTLMLDKLHILKQDLERRKYRAFTHCNPNLTNEFSPQCYIIWKSIENTETFMISRRGAAETQTFNNLNKRTDSFKCTTTTTTTTSP